MHQRYLSFCLCLQLLFTIFCLAYVMWFFVLLSLWFNSSQQALQNNFWFDTTSDSSLNSETRCGLIFVAANDHSEEFVLLHLHFPHEDGFIAVLCFLSISDFHGCLNPSSKDIALSLRIVSLDWLELVLDWLKLALSFLYSVSSKLCSLWSASSTSMSTLASQYYTTRFRCLIYHFYLIQNCLIGQWYLT